MKKYRKSSSSETVVRKLETQETVDKVPVCLARNLIKDKHKGVKWYVKFHS